ncbi:MAG: hypothetical protein NUV91_01260 [Candidatus Omnitrophica bacterium]|nr:hypothetical protein [Candidatus Omnitrophota bacterium]
MKKIVAILTLTLLFSFSANQTKGAENPLPKATVEIAILGDGSIRYETGLYTFYVKKGETEPEIVQIWKGPDDLKYQIMVTKTTSRVFDKGSDFQRPITKLEKEEWESTWKKLKKTVRVVAP